MLLAAAGDPLCPMEKTKKDCEKDCNLPLLRVQYGLVGLR